MVLMTTQGEDSQTILIWSSTVSGSRGTPGPGMILSAGENRNISVRNLSKMKIKTDSFYYFLS